MKADVLDETMVAFADGAHDVLLTTNIIESGLDIPSANTMLVWRPDRFGLADLHQLRGRVGRGRRRGMVYLLTDPGKPLAQATEKRVRTLQALEGLGAGFAIGARDLDMRGAGDLLGAEQSGHVRLIGAELYQHLLQRAVRRVRGGQGDADAAPDIRIGLGIAIPRDYVPEEEIRIDIYRRLARLQSHSEASDLANEIADRFGPLPNPVHDIFDFCAIRAQCASSHVAKIEAGPSGTAVTFADEQARTLAEQAPLEGLGATKWAGERLILQVATETPHQRLQAIGKLLGALKAC
jgi:transcription-repair coupling factor (superfamily II helicase)